MEAKKVDTYDKACQTACISSLQVMCLVSWEGLTPPIL